MRQIVEELERMGADAQREADDLHNDDWTQGKADAYLHAVDIVRRIGGLDDRK